MNTAKHLTVIPPSLFTAEDFRIITLTGLRDAQHQPPLVALWHKQNFSLDRLDSKAYAQEES